MVLASVEWFVLTVKNRFAEGEFSQELECVRDPTIDLNLCLSEPQKFTEKMDAYNREVDEAQTLHMGE